jgi:lysophospholipase L1-like esterase
MKWMLLTFMCCASVAFSAPSTQPTSRRAKVRIALAGDSTMQPTSGWGPGFAAQLTGDIECLNFARGGRSSKSFINEGHWKETLDSKPDYILIQFGHNDQPGKGPERETDPKTTYPEFMARYVDDARAIGAKPILITSIERRKWKDVKIVPSLTEYADAVKKVAKEKNVPLIDMNARTIELYEKLGEKGCEALEPPDPKNPGKLDATHLNAKGAQVIGKVVAEELKKVAPELDRYIKTP